MFSRQVPLSDVATFCRALRHNLGAGLTLVRVMEQQAQRGPRSLRAVADRLAIALKQGTPVGEAFQREKDYFPPLFLAMAKLGAETGHLSEIMGELEQYFTLQYRLRRQFRTQSFLPVLQFLFAVFLIAGLIFLLGMIAASNNARPLLSFFGLGGAAGSLAFLAVVFGTLGGLYFVYAVLLRWMHQRAAADRLLLSLPFIGPCLQTILLGRFALALQLTLDSGLTITKGLRLSLDATGNAAYAAGADGVVRVLKEGQTLYEALALARLFPEEFLHIIATAEESGRVPEVMRQQAEYYNEEAARKLTLLTRAAGMGVWFVYAGFMIWAIFSIARVYLGALGL